MNDNSMGDGLFMTAFFLVAVSAGIMGGIFGGVAVWFLTH